MEDKFRKLSIEIVGKWMLDDKEKDYPSLYEKIEQAFIQIDLEAREECAEIAEKTLKNDEHVTYYEKCHQMADAIRSTIKEKE